MGKHTAKRGEGSMYQNKDGYYTFKVYYIDIDNKKKRKGFSGWDPDETRMRAKEFLRDIEDMRNGVERMATIPQILKRRYELDYKNGYTQEPGYYRNMASLKKIEDSAIGKKPIAKITLLDIQDFLGTLRRYSNSVIRKTYSQLRLAYGEAIIAEIVTKNLMLSSQIRCPKSAMPDKRIPALSIEEQQALVETLAKHKKWGTRNEYSKQILIEHSPQRQSFRAETRQHVAGPDMVGRVLFEVCELLLYVRQTQDQRIKGVRRKGDARSTAVCRQGLAHELRQTLCVRGKADRLIDHIAGDALGPETAEEGRERVQRIPDLRRAVEHVQPRDLQDQVRTADHALCIVERIQRAADILRPFKPSDQARVHDAKPADDARVVVE